MSGGEVAGLALGTIALASLFQNCIELFDYFEVAKNYHEDQDIACVKFALVRERLRTWGSNLHILEPGKESLALQEEVDAVKGTLLKLKSLLGASELLVRKYDLGKTPSRSLKLRRRTLWAVHDKKRFERVIQDMAFLMENLEKVTGTSNAASPRSDALGRERLRNSYSNEPTTRKDRLETNERLFPFLDKGRESTFDRCGDGGEDSDEERDSSYRSDQTHSSKEKPAQTSQRQHVISGEQRNSGHTVGVQGTVGSLDGTAFVSGTQTNSDYAFAFQGAMSADAFLEMHKRQLELQKLSGSLSSGESSGRR